jgi:hypothetical protein
MRFAVVVDGREHAVKTNARDMAAVEKYLDPSVDEPDTLRTLRVVHAALLRTDAADIPSDFDKFVDLVDDLDPLDDVGESKVTPGTPDPTRAAD